MRQASKRVPDSAEKTLRDIRIATRRHHSAEEKIRIVLEGLRGEDSIGAFPCLTLLTLKRRNRRRRGRRSPRHRCQW